MLSLHQHLSFLLHLLLPHPGFVDEELFLSDTRKTFPLVEFTVLILVGHVLTSRKLVRPLHSYRLALRYTSHHLDHFTFGSSSGHSSLDHSSSGHSTPGHSLSGHAPPDITIANSSTPPRFVYPPLARTPRSSEAYLCWRYLKSFSTTEIEAKVQQKFKRKHAPFPRASRIASRYRNPSSTLPFLVTKLVTFTTPRRTRTWLMMCLAPIASWMDRDGRGNIITIDSINRPDILDPALVHARKKPMSEDVDYAAVAAMTDGMVGAELENIVEVATINKMRNGRTKSNKTKGAKEALQSDLGHLDMLPTDVVKLLSDLARLG
ncbi:putative reverse transcriptase domain-containing protein [Tanacetum coccineum]